MNCPRCKTPLTAGPNSASRLAFWDCSQCMGRAVATHGKQPAIDEKFEKWLWELAQDSTPSLEMRCPRCVGFMRPVVLFQAKTPIEVDACISCHTLWFDPGEMEQLLHRPAEKKPGALQEDPIQMFFALLEAHFYYGDLI